MSRAERVEKTAGVEALINYSVDVGVKPASYGGIDTFEADKKRTGKYLEHKVSIHDGRVIANELSLEREGFIFVRHATRVKNFYDEAEVRAAYYPEIEQLVKKPQAPNASWSSITRFVPPTARCAKPSRSAVRCAMRTMTIPNGPGHNGYAICSPMKPMSF